MIFWSAQSRRVPGPRVDFTCPKCLCGPTSGSSYEQTDSAHLFFVIPILRMRNTFVICDQCKSRLFCVMTLDDLTQSAGADISRFLSYRISFVFKTLSILSLLLCVFPVLGTVLSCITLIGTYKSPGVWRTIAIISFVISLVPTSLVAFHIWR
jgi:hypothetical protein